MSADHHRPALAARPRRSGPCACPGPTNGCAASSGRCWSSASSAPIVWWLWSTTRPQPGSRARIATGFGFLRREAGLPIGECADRLQPDRHLSARAARRPAEHAAGRHRRHRPGDHPRHADRHRAGCRRTGCSPRSPASMSRSSATCRCCCSCCSGTRSCRRCPAPRQALNPVAGVFLSNRGLKLPWIEWQRRRIRWALLAFVVGIVATWLYRAPRMRQADAGLASRARSGRWRSG